MDITEARYFAYKEFDRIVALAEELYDVNIDTDRGWYLDFNDSKRCLGVCSYSKKVIYLSNYLLATNNEAEITDTLAHEIAHALTPGCNHNKKWKAVCKALGGNGERTAKGFDMQCDHKYELYLPSTGEVFKKYYKKSRRDPSNLYMDGRRDETLGKLQYRKVA